MFAMSHLLVFGVFVMDTVDGSGLCSLNNGLCLMFTLVVVTSYAFCVSTHTHYLLIR